MSRSSGAAGKKLIRVHLQSDCRPETLSARKKIFLAPPAAVDEIFDRSGRITCLHGP